MSRVRIGTCASPADAAFLRSMFSARGIPIVIGAEHHASLFGPLSSGFLSLDIWVDADDAEEAAALLRDLRESDGAAGAAGEAEGSDDAGGEAERTGEPEDAGEADDELRDAWLARRRRTVVAVVCGSFITFGTAHMVTGAWRRGIALALIQIAGLIGAISGHAVAGVAVPAAILADLIGAVWRARTPAVPQLPKATLRAG